VRPRLLLVTAAALLAFLPRAEAEDRRSLVVATVGSAKITLGDFEDRIAPDKVPTFQLRAFGDTPEAIKKRFLDEVILPEVLLGLGAEARKIADDPAVAFQLERSRAEATLRAVRAGVGAAAQIPMADVKKFYDENLEYFDAPERYLVWRILCRTRDEAATVLEEAKKDLRDDKFYELARAHSVDKGTYFRNGNLGYLSADGVSKEPGFKVDPSIVKAAAAVKDNELVAEPIVEHTPDGDRFAVVWRRSHLPPSRRSVEDAAAQIRDTLWKRRVEAAQKKLLDDLRATKLSDLDEQRVGAFEISLGDAGISPRGRPGQVPPKK
jgi:peptidyl-prolyl cis-trans isomerase C